jgi:hypothetical protein
MPSKLDYASRESSARSWVISSFICGILSGPAALGLAFFAAYNQLEEQKKELLGLLALVIVLGGTFAFSCVSRARLPITARYWTRVFANLAIVTPLLWAGAILAFIMYALSHV